MRNKKYEILDFVLSLIYPERCVVCDSVVAYGQGVCRKCINRLKLIGDKRCLKCGKLIADESKEYCEDCSEYSHIYTRGWPLYVYNDSIRNSIYRFKYGNRQKYAKFYGQMIVKHLGRQIQEVNPDAIVPVPLHKEKLRQRGYNQAYLIANEIGQGLNIPVKDGLIKRIRYTEPLKFLGAEERQNNLKKAFKIAQYDVKLKTIILVDDIYTTGSTIDEISAVLKESGIMNVYFVTLSAGCNI